MLKLETLEIHLMNQLVIKERNRIYHEIDTAGTRGQQENKVGLYSQYLTTLDSIHEKLLRGGETHADDDSGSRKKASKVVQSGK